jgi:hypothetical protein
VRGRVCAFERTVRSDGSGPVVEAEAGA